MREEEAQTALEIFKLVGSIFVDNEKADESLHKTDSKAQGVGETLSKGIQTAAKWGTALVAGATAAASGVVKLATGSAATSDRVDKLSQKIGISREAFQELDYVTSQCGMSVESLQGGVKAMTSQMLAASKGTASSSAYFKELGVSVTDTSGKLRSQEDVFFDVVTALQGMENETERNAIASKLLGKSATEMGPLLNAGAGAMEDMRQQAHDLGLVLEDDVINNGVNLTDAMDRMKRSFSAIVTKLGGSVMPLVEKVADWITSYMPQLQSAVDRFAPVIVMMFAGIVPPLMALAEELLPVVFDLLTALLPVFTNIVQAVLPVIVQLVKMLLPPFVQIVQQLLPPLLTALSPLLSLLSPLIQLLNPILEIAIALIQPLVNIINNCIPPLVSAIKTLSGVLIDKLKPILQAVTDTIKTQFSKVLEGIRPIIDAVIGYLGGLINFITGVFTGNWKNAWNGIKTIFTNIWNGIKASFKTPINFIIDGINGFIRGINKIKIPDWVPGVGGRGFSISQIPRLARGGVLERGQLGLLEGSGAEAVVPLENNQKWISRVAQDMDVAMGGASGARVEALLVDLIELVRGLAKAGIYLDTGALVGGLAKPMDRRLGEISARKARA